MTSAWRNLLFVTRGWSFLERLWTFQWRRVCEVRLNCCRFAWFCVPLWDFTKTLNLWKFGTLLVAGSLSRRCRAAPSNQPFHQTMSVGFSRQPGSFRAPLRVWYPKLHYKQINFHKMELFPFLQIPWNPFSNNSVFLEFESKLGKKFLFNWRVLALVWLCWPLAVLAATQHILCPCPEGDFRQEQSLPSKLGTLRVFPRGELFCFSVPCVPPDARHHTVCTSWTQRPTDRDRAAPRGYWCPYWKGVKVQSQRSQSAGLHCKGALLLAFMQQHIWCEWCLQTSDDPLPLVFWAASPSLLPWQWDVCLHLIAFFFTAALSDSS